MGVGASLLLLKIWPKNADSGALVQAIDKPAQKSLTGYLNNAPNNQPPLIVGRHKSHEPQVESQKIRAEIVELSNFLEESNAIERLNADTVVPEERSDVGDKLKRLDYLRAKELDLELAAIEQKLAELQIKLPARLQTYGVLQP